MYLNVFFFFVLFGFLSIFFFIIFGFCTTGASSYLVGSKTGNVHTALIAVKQ